MNHYRLYELGEDGRVVRGDDLQCHDEEEALTVAAALAELGRSVEVWQGTRLLKQLLGRLKPGAGPRETLADVTV